MPPKPDEGQELQFVVTTNPGQASTAANRKRVRSQAALKSWPERRKRNFEQLEDASTGRGRGAFRVATPTPPARLQKKAQAQKQQPLPEPGSGTIRDLALISPPSSPEPARPFTGMADPFNCYPVPYKPWFDGILHHMLTVFAPRGWPALKITRDQGLSWERFMQQHASSEPALFYVRLLFASGDLIRMKVLQPEIALWLRAAAIKAINEALRDPKRASSDPLILAVGRIALHESLYGDRNAADTIHRPAQQRMIQMRGGMKALDFPELVKRLMRWSDTVMSKQGGTERFLEDDEKVHNFTLGESVQVLEQWVPQQGEDLRKKIRISDILNK
ncbi:hypothetical protein B0A55_11314 [Friedmanniomyces simplex]|uniref:Uncharacterized protein n=1 Tax=Friedmanniomyces simplex TaxID=329884 RepID=A0A4U0WQ20_9PEZI|nr:hypothetical protein B0A55_11314 [Friedmanniomyces simplex]